MDLFLPISKVDQAQRLVYGTVTEEVPDRSGEVMDYASSKPYFEKWSGEFQKATGGLSSGNVRAMHGSVAAGRLNQVSFDDEARKIEAVAHIVDDSEWAKVEKGVYTGFSIGGAYAKRWPDESDASLTRYTASPNEVSLVDRPCLPTAQFTMIKADGSREERGFMHAELRKSALTQCWTCGIDGHTHMAKADATACLDDTLERLSNGETVEGVGAALLALAKAEKHKKEDGKEFPASDYAYVPDADKPSTWKLRLTDEPGAEPDARIVGDAAAALGAGFRGNKVEIPEADRAKVVARVRAAWKKANPGKDADDMPESIKAKKADVAGSLEKGMYGVSAFARIIADFNNLVVSSKWEADAEGDNSKVPAKLRAAQKVLGELLVEMAQEETAELNDDDDDELALAARAGDLNKADADLARAPSADMAKAIQQLPAGMEGIQKILADSLARHDELFKAALASRDAQINDLTDQVKKLNEQPEPAKGVVRVISKENETAMDKATGTAVDPSDTRGLIKAAHANPMRMLG